ncbi:MAG TPA: hypothetical protein VK465_03990 [Fibrobacteria bacterium]|nr:hypothetical protein [Fibrobacteria bacterium]
MIATTPKPAQPLVLSARLGLVSVPEVPDGLPREALFDVAEARERIRALGLALGLSLLARREAGFPEAAAPTEGAALDEALRRTLEGVDVVWMQGDEVVAAFVVEVRPGSYEGLRRLADTLALFPKLKAPLYAVTAPALESGLLAEVHRPVYRLLKKPLTELLRLLDWERLKSEVDQLGERVRYLKPEFLEGISDPVEAPHSEG